MSMKTGNNSGMAPMPSQAMGNSLMLRAGMAGNLPGPMGAGSSQNSPINLMGPPTQAGGFGSNSGAMNLFHRINPSGAGMFQDIMSGQGSAPALGKNNSGNSFLNFGGRQ